LFIWLSAYTTMQAGLLSNVMVHFKDYVELDKKDIQPLANAIAASVLNAPVPRSLNEAVEIPGAVARRPHGLSDPPSVDGEDKLWAS